MSQVQNFRADRQSIKGSAYVTGEYFQNAGRHSEDAQFKADNFLRMFLPIAKDLKISSYADVGCGSGDVTRIIADSLKESGLDLEKVKGYDISPHVKYIEQAGTEFVCGDFCEVDEFFDLVTVFDVLEHTPDPIQFIRQVSQRCQIVGFHIPLDYSLNATMRDLFRSKLRDPGHIIYLDTVSALNLLALAGLRVIDYEYTFAFLAPSGYRSGFQKTIFPVRFLLAKISPWLLSKTLGGAGLMVLALTRVGSNKIDDRAGYSATAARRLYLNTRFS